MSQPTLGIIGGGQLGMMLAQAARTLNINTIALDPNPSCPASHVCDIITANYDDPQALDELAAKSDTVTYEFENVPVDSAHHVMRTVPVRPGPLALETAQDRLNERTMFAHLDIPAPPMRPIDSLDSLRIAVQDLGTPCLLKARRLGYDGKGQALIDNPASIDLAWQTIGEVPAILDAFVPFSRELSIIATRATDGSVVTYPLNHNIHRAGILRVTKAPARDVPDPVYNQAKAAATKVLNHLDYVGTIAVEFFQVGAGENAQLIANEIAPRVHNTGHWTIEGTPCSQFENHVRAVMNLPLVDPTPAKPSAMINIIGHHPRPGALQSLTSAHLHDYHKAERPNRKLAHITLTADTEPDLDARLEHCNRIVG